MTIDRPILLYDDACGRCRRFAALVRALNWGGRIEVGALESDRAAALLPDMTLFQRLEALRFLTPEGGHFTAAEATSELFTRLLPTGWAWRPMRATLPGLRAAVRWLYAHAAQTRKCAVAP
jgi:predicted DCC family thiol-disulfide oxidoreductase YuxK